MTARADINRRSESGIFLFLFGGTGGNAPVGWRGCFPVLGFEAKRQWFYPTKWLENHSGTFHRLLHTRDESRKLLRVYTQNLDGIERKYYWEVNQIDFGCLCKSEGRERHRTSRWRLLERIILGAWMGIVDLDFSVAARVGVNSWLCSNSVRECSRRGGTVVRDWSFLAVATVVFGTVWQQKLDKGRKEKN